MGAILLEIINNRIIQAAALAWAIAQAIKVLLTLAISRKFDHTRVLGSGGMPSSHSSMACAMLMVIGFHEGFSSSVFALAFCFAGPPFDGPKCRCHQPHRRGPFRQGI